jgi:hypothetical protein
MTTSKISFPAANSLVNKFATGKSLRIMQMWATKHECLKGGSYFTVTLKDNKIGCSVNWEGSDL